MSLKSKTKAESPNLWNLEVEISAEDFKQAEQLAFNKKKNKIAIPGFRKGKVPMKMAKSFYGEGFLYEDALDICFEPALNEAIAQAELQIVGTENANIKEIGPNGVLITIDAYEKPEVTLGEYKGLCATVAPIEVTDEEVKGKLDALVERNARILDVEDRKSQMGDITKIDFEGFVDGVAFEGGKAEDYELTLGSNSFIPGFEEQICGHDLNEEFDINVTFPEEYEESLKGKDATFKIKLKEIKVKQLPEVNDEFAQDAADFDTLDELMASLKKEVEDEKKSNQDAQIRDQVFRQMAENATIDVPNPMVETECDNQLQELDYRLQSQGMSAQMYLQYLGMDVKDYKEQMKPQALANVRTRLCIEKIAEVEGIEVADVDVETEYGKMSENYDMDVEKIKEIVPAEDLKRDIKFNKAMDLVIESAVVTEKEPEEEKPETQDEQKAEDAAE